MKKILIGIVIGLAVLFIAAVLVAGFELNGIVKRGVEIAGPKVAKVDIKLDSVGLSLFSGSGKIDGLVVGSPEGFRASQTISARHFTFALSPGSLLSDRIVIKSIKIDAADITYEIGAGGSNLKKILANLDQSTSGSDARAAAKPKEAGRGRKLEVDEFILTGGKLHLNVTGLGGATLPLPPIHLINLGKGDADFTGAELAKQVLAAIEKDAAKTAADRLDAVAIGATGLVKGLAGGTSNAVGGAVNKIGNGIGNLLKTK
jgi:hypothetical protein